MRASRFRRLALLAGVALGVAAFVAATAGASVRGGGDRHEIEGVEPAWAAAAPKTADVPASQGVAARVWLQNRNQAQLDALAQAVSDPNSAQYGQFISEAQYRDQFAPTADQVSAVMSWLTGAGLSVVAVGPDNHYVAVNGTADAINAAFGTKLSTYSGQGKTFQAPSLPVSVPSSVAGIVSTVTGLSTFGHFVQPTDLGAPGAFVNATPCSQYYGEKTASTLPQFNGQTLAYAPCGYTPSQLRGVYGVGGEDGHGHSNGDSENAGRGATVAITDAFDASTLQADANTYASRHGDEPFHGQQFQDRSVPEPSPTTVDPGSGDTYVNECGGNGWYGEQTLDVEAVHGMAPAANVLYYGAYSCLDSDLLAQLSQVVSDNQASIVTNSWGEPTFVANFPDFGCTPSTPCATIDQGLINAYESVFKQGAVQGIGFYFSSGDSGDEAAAWGIAHPDWPTEDPWVTSVGGTSLGVGEDNNRLFETGWGTARYALDSSGLSWALQIPFVYGAGGGFTQLGGQATFNRPWYQNGVVPSGSVGRGVPDVSMDADPNTGMLVGETQSFPLASAFGPAGVHYGEYRIGGTSLASPLMAGAQADKQSSWGEEARIGFANPLIYTLSHRPGVFYDVTPQGPLGDVRVDYRNGINADNGLRTTVRTFDQDSSLTTGSGWDDVSGVGSVTADYLNAPGRRH